MLHQPYELAAIPCFFQETASLSPKSDLLYFLVAYCSVETMPLLKQLFSFGLVCGELEFNGSLVKLMRFGHHGEQQLRMQESGKKEKVKVETEESGGKSRGEPWRRKSNNGQGPTLLPTMG